MAARICSPGRSPLHDSDGIPAFPGNSALTVSYKVVNRDPIPATVLETELPPGLDYIIARAMAKDPAQRYQRGMEMALDIQDLREGRELWSKAKQPGLTAGGMPATPGEKTGCPQPESLAPTPNLEPPNGLPPIHTAWRRTLLIRWGRNPSPAPRS